jgi:hypothetical protein
MVGARKHKLKKKYPKELWHSLVNALQFDGTQESCNLITNLIGIKNCIIKIDDEKPWFLITTWIIDRTGNVKEEIRVDVGNWVLVSVDNKKASPEVWFDDLFQKAYRK